MPPKKKSYLIRRSDSDDPISYVESGTGLIVLYSKFFELETRLISLEIIQNRSV